MEADNNSALITACQVGNTGMVEMLLGNPNVNEDYCSTTASERGYLDVLQLLLSDKRTALADLTECLEDAINCDHTEVALYLLTFVGRSDVSDYMFTDVVRTGNHAIVRAILTSYPAIDPSAEDNEALKIAIGRGHFEVVKILLADNRTRATILYEELLVAVSAGYLDIVRLLLDGKLSEPGMPVRVLSTACKTGNMLMVKLLLGYQNVLPHELNNLPLRYARENGYTEIVELLLTYKEVQDIEAGRCRVR
ncbi:Hypothetical protein POVR2_LOCUS399 [uncultured virus]|nr:Hypothetical protein POVR2_LOCUS399 [uncultured virus]